MHFNFHSTLGASWTVQVDFATLLSACCETYLTSFETSPTLECSKCKNATIWLFGTPRGCAIQDFHEDLISLWATKPLPPLEMFLEATREYDRCSAAFQAYFSKAMPQASGDEGRRWVN